MTPKKKTRRTRKKVIPPKKRRAKRKRSSRALPETPKVEKRKKAATKKALAKKSPSTYLVRVSEIRRGAAVDYITDPEARSAEYWHGRKDRPYHRAVVYQTFRVWQQEDEWTSRRTQFWAEITERIIAERQKQVLIAGLQELEELTEVRMYMGEYLNPLRTADGAAQRYPKDHPLAGLPMMPLKMPDLDKFVKMFLALEKHLMLKRGEAVTRTDSVGDDKKVPVSSLDPIAQKVSIGRQDVLALAQLLLERRQPQLVEGAVIDVPVEEDDDDDDENRSL